MGKAGTPLSGAEILVQCLVRHGVEAVFAYPGGASMPIHQALTHARGRIRTILPRHEQGGGFMAEGYARSTGKVGVCLATSGPGATNLVTCLADAKMDSVPLVAITGQVNSAVMGTDAFQETPIAEVSRTITKHAYLVPRTEDLPRVLKEAFHIATTGRPGPVLVDVPKDVQVRKIVPGDEDPPMRLPGYEPGRRATRAELERVLELVRRSKRPVIYAGGGVIASSAAPHLRAFAERHGIPVALTLMGLGGFPADHFLCLNMLGMHGTVYANYAIHEADLLLALGVRFDDRVTGKVSEFAKHGKIVHIDIDPSELNKIKQADLAIHGDVGLALRDLLELMDEKEGKPVSRTSNIEHGTSNVERNGAGRAKRTRNAAWLRRVEQWRDTEPLRYEDRDDVLMPQYVIDRLWHMVRDRGQLENTIVTSGVGQHQMWAAQYYRFASPRTWLTSGGHGAMGFGLPAALGAQVAHPDKTVIDIDGDGSFQMNVQELACAYCEKLPVKVLVLNNQHLGMVCQWEDRFFDGNRGHTYLGAGHDQEPYPDYVALANSYRVDGCQVRSKDTLDVALEEMLHSSGPFLLDVLVPYQEHVLPMIPSGQSVREMIKLPGALGPRTPEVPERKG